MEHFFVMTEDVDKTRDFYSNALGMSAGYRPEFVFPGYWMYLGDIPVVHIALQDPYIAWTNEAGLPVADGPPGSGAIDHIAFNCEDYESMKQNLETQGVDLITREIPDFNLRQLFLKDPNGVTIELNFHS